ncbi:MAG: hypothetical protein J2P50_01545 [Hyphomicrobiaceae bacterium]|nr:hypothetical protein [Hyphomicrobiaceae bacterium]
MVDYREILALQKNPARAAATAQSLVHMEDMAWTDWELDFLDSIGSRLQDLTTRQGEKLAELWEEAAWYTTVEGFSLRALIERCHLCRDELSRCDAEFIARLRTAEATRLRRKDARRVLECARRIAEIEPYQGHTLKATWPA